jgi:pimeloyl-ACP methyl ester carboxylesterase
MASPLVAPDVGSSAALFLAARHPDAVRSLVTGGGATAYPLDVAGTLAEIIAAPAIEVFEGHDIRATIGAAVELAAPRGQEPEVWEDYVSAYEAAGSPSRRVTSAPTLSNCPCYATSCPRSVCRYTSSPPPTTRWCRCPTDATWPTGYPAAS